jgi:hypothetical protein
MPRAAQGVGRTTLEVASTLPDALSARTWKKLPLATGIAVSKPALGLLATGFR